MRRLECFNTSSLTPKDSHTLSAAVLIKLCLFCAGSTSEAARIIYPPASRTMTVRKGHRLVLECVASGTPTPQVTWAKDGRELSPQNNTRFLLSNLLIDAVSERDSGTYACHAHNGMGSPGTATVLYDVQVIGECSGHAGTARGVRADGTHRSD